MSGHLHRTLMDGGRVADDDRQNERHYIRSAGIRGGDCCRKTGGLEVFCCSSQPRSSADCGRPLRDPISPPVFQFSAIFKRDGFRFWHMTLADLKT